MVERNEEFRRLQAYHENTRIAIRYLDSPMARLVKEIKIAMKKMPAQKEILQLGLDELEERLRRIRIRRINLAPLPEAQAPGAATPPGAAQAPAPGAPAARRIEGEYGIEILSPTEGAARQGILQGALQRWHARIKPADGYLVPKERVRWSSDKEGVIKGIEETRLDEGRATHAFIQFKFKIPGDHVVTAEAVDNRGNRYTAQLPVKVIAALPADAGDKFTGGEIPIRGAEAHFVQPSEIGWRKGLPMHKNITFIAELSSSDGKPFKARKVRFTSDKEGNLGAPLVKFENGVTIAYATHLFATQGERTISIEAIDESGAKAFDTRLLKILPRTLTQAQEEFTGALGEGEAPFTVDKFIAEKLRPAIDDLHGIYVNALKHANRDMRFLVKWKRRAEKDFADVKDVGTDVQKDARDGRIDKLKKHVKRLKRDLRAFESGITFFNRAMREQRMLNHFLVQTRDGIIAVRNLTHQISIEPEEQVMERISGKRVQRVHELHNKFETANTWLVQSYATIRSRIQEMGRRVQRIDGGIKRYKEDLDGMIDALQSPRPHEQIVAELASRLRDIEGTVQKELLLDINGMIELLRGIIDDVAASQKQLDRLEELGRKLKA